MGAKEWPPIYDVLFSMRGTLLNAVAPQLRAVTVDVDPLKEELYIFFFYDGEITDELFDLASVATFEIGSPYDWYFTEKDPAVRWDFPKEIPVRGKLAFLRKEPKLPEFTRESRTFLLKTGENPLFVFLLDVQEALLGKVTPALREVRANIDPDRKKLIVNFYYDGEISAEDMQLAQAVARDAQISFTDYEMEPHIIRIDFPAEVPPDGGRAVYWRQEIKYGPDGVREECL